MIRTILVAVDTSRRAPHVVDAAGAIAQKFGATPRLLRVIELSPDIPPAAAKYDVDLIVVGSHGYHGWDRVLGTTASRVANLADRDVLVVRERKS